MEEVEGEGMAVGEEVGEGEGMSWMKVMLQLHMGEEVKMEVSRHLLPVFNALCSILLHVLCSFTARQTTVCSCVFTYTYRVC